MEKLIHSHMGIKRQSQEPQQSLMDHILRCDIKLGLQFRLWIYLQAAKGQFNTRVKHLSVWPHLDNIFT